jgi:hypothetical protein
MPLRRKFSKRRNLRKMRSRRTKRVGNCNMVHDMLYEPPCQGPQVLLRGGGEVPLVTQHSGCESYEVDVTQGRVGGQPIISGNPSGCLDTQMHSFSRSQGGGGAACPAGFRADFSQPHIGGQPVLVPINDHCGASISHMAGGARKGKGKSNRGKGKSNRGKGKSNRGKGKSNRGLKKAIEKYCKRRRKSCSKKFKKTLYKKVERKLCN